MKRANKLILAGLLTTSLMTPSISAIANANENHGQHGQRNGSDKHQGKRFDRSTHDRRDFGHNQRDLHRNGRWDDHNRRDARHDIRHDRRHDGRVDNRGHHNKPEIRQDFKDVRNARNEVKQDRTELRKDYAELKKDRAELRRDVRNGASKAEILTDRKEIQSDLKEIRNDRVELQKDQAKLDAARQELKNDLRKR